MLGHQFGIIVLLMVDPILGSITISIGIAGSDSMGCYVCTICLAIFCGDIRLHSPKNRPPYMNKYVYIYICQSVPEVAIDYVDRRPLLDPTY